jgi:hypothetical protein
MSDFKSKLIIFKLSKVRKYYLIFEHCLIMFFRTLFDKFALDKHVCQRSFPD